MSFVAVDNEVIIEDMLKIAYGTNYDPIGLQYEVMLHTVKYDMEVNLLESIEILGDYVNNVSDYILVSFMFPMGDYVKDVLPNSENLEMSIIYKYYDKSVVIRYKAVLVNNRGGVHNQVQDGMDRDSLNNTQQVRLEVQCVDRLIEVMRTTYCNSIYNYSTLSTAMKFAVKETLFKDKKRKDDFIIKIADKDLSDSKLTKFNIDIVEPDNTEEYRHINIPFGTNIMDVPTLFQEKEYGVYNGGIGTYLKVIDILNTKYMPVKGRYSYFVYPLYNNTRYENPVNKLLVLGITINKFKHIDKTYKLDDKILKIIASGNTKDADNGDNDNIDQGTGIIANDEYKFLNMYSNVTDEQTTDSNAKDNLIAANRIKREDSVSKLNYIGTEYNLFRHNTEINKKKYMLVQITWNYSNPELLIPGMPVAYVYKHERYGVIKIKGTLASSFSKYSKTTKTISTVLNLLVEKPFDPEYKAKNTVIDLRS